MLIYWRVTTLFHLFPKLLAVLQAVGIITLIKCADAEDVPPATSGMIRDHMCVPFFKDVLCLCLVMFSLLVGYIYICEYGIRM